MTTGKLFLDSISLQNFATFENQSVHFDNVFNAIVGETGSGKSLILDAFQLLLGSRADKKLIRKGSDFAIIEGTFHCEDPDVVTFLDGLGFPFEEKQITVKRIIYRSGTSKSFLNHQNCSLNILTAFSKRFVDLVGQFENQKLLSPNYQLQLIDHYGKLDKDVEAYKITFKELTSVKNKIANLEEQSSLKAERQDYLKFQIKELERLEPSISDEDELLQQKELILNKERSQEIIQKIQFQLSESDQNILSQLKLLQKDIGQFPNLFPESLSEKWSNIIDHLEEISFEVSKGQSEREENQQNLDDILDRLDLYQTLKRKFHVDTEGLQAKYEEFSQEISKLDSIDSQLNELREKESALRESCYQMANSLHKNRVQLATKLSSKMSTFIQKLNMKGATILIEVNESQELNSFGYSLVEILAETNPGEGFFPMKEIASGGELSRILLGLRQIVSSTDTISIFFFDEIDTGIGGETAKKIAEALKDVAGKSQVITITHLAQIAKKASSLIHVSKKTIESKDKSLRTISIAESINKTTKKQVLETLAGL